MDFQIRRRLVKHPRRLVSLMVLQILLIEFGGGQPVQFCAPFPVGVGLKVRVAQDWVKQEILGAEQQWWEHV